MKKTLLALPALVAIAGTAYAQSSVTIYGIMDANVEYTNNSNAAKNSLTRLNSGGMNTSRLGFRGAEDLGGGLKAIFQLESGIKLDTGGLDGDLFGRQANVGLKGDFGQLVAGRSFSTTYDFILPMDPMGYSAQYSWVTSGNTTAAGTGAAVRKDGMLTGVSNMLKYQFEANGFKLGATYGFGETSGSTADNAKYSIGAGYANGPLNLATTYDQVNGTVATTGSRDKASTYHLAGTYQMGGFKGLLGFRNYTKTLASGAADLKSNMIWGGLAYQLNEASSLTGAIYRQDIKNLAAGADADPIMYVLRYKYGFSKRTDLYVATAYAKAKNGKLVGVSRDDAGFGNSQDAFTVGIQHRF